MIFSAQKERVTSTSSVNSETGEHVYTITGTICVESATCNEAYANEVFDYVNGKNDVPLDGNSEGNGERSLIPYLPSLLGSQPIYHCEVPSMRMSLNIAFPSHNFHPSTVMHQVGFVNGNLTYTVKGNGIGDTPNINNWAGDKYGDRDNWDCYFCVSCDCLYRNCSFVY